MPDFSARYSAEQYGRLLMNLLPAGPAFPRIPNTSIWKMLSALAIELNRVDSQINALVKEAYPQLTTTLIGNWEREMGLPGFFTLPATVQERQDLIEFVMIGISNLHIANGLSEQFWELLAAEPFIDYLISSFTYFDRLAVGPGQRAHLVGDSHVGSDVIDNIGDTSTAKVGDFVTIDQGFPFGKCQILEKDAVSIRVSLTATADVVGTIVRLYDEHPALCGDPVGDAFLNVFEAAVPLPDSAPPYTPHFCITTQGSDVVTNVDSAMNAVVGYYMLFERGFNTPYQKILAKTANTLTVEHPADHSEVDVEAEMKTRGGELLENAFNWLKSSHTKILFKYS
jgi:uncharacterized protein YmfQ (DUF2313 family)